MTFMDIIKNGFDPEAAEALRVRYDSDGYLHLEGFFDSFLAEHFRSYVTPEQMKNFYSSQAGSDYVKVDYQFAPEFIKEYNYLINQENYINFLSAITGHTDIGKMQGHVYISDSREKRGYWYHSDNDGNRYFLVSINISNGIYEGGIFSMRDPRDKKILWQVQNNQSYGALIAKIGDNYEHAISDVTGEVTRITLLSWALIEPKCKRFKMF